MFIINSVNVSTADQINSVKRVGFERSTAWETVVYCTSRGLHRSGDDRVEISKKRVYINAIWLKLLNDDTGGDNASLASSKMVRMLKSMYNSVKMFVKSNSTMADYLNSYIGVKQGETLSPLLFILFFNDMSSYIQGAHADVVTLNELPIYLLFFADDTVLSSYSVVGLQTLLNKSHDCCKCWNVAVNVNKTVAMVCKTGLKNENVVLFYNHEKIKVVSKFTYLCDILSYNGKHYQSQRALVGQALKATFFLKALFEHVSLKPSDCMILPIMNYGS